MSKLDIDSIVKLADLGLRIGAAIVERHSGKPLSSMSQDEIQSAIDAISIRPVDDLIAEGEEKAKGRVSNVMRTGASKETQPVPSIPLTPPIPSEIFENDDDDNNEDLRGGFPV